MKFDKRKELKIKRDNETETVILQGINDIVNSNQYQNYLNLTMNVAHMSPNNKMNLALQAMIRQESITFVKTAACWKRDYERNIKKGSKAFYVQRPSIKKFDNVLELYEFYEKHPLAGVLNRVKEKMAEEIGNKGHCEIITGFSWIPEFDVSQTQGKDLPEHEFQKNIDKAYENFEEMTKALEDYSKKNGIEVLFKEKGEDSILEHAYGYYSPTSEKIVVCTTNRSQSDQIKTMIHEIAHALLHGKEMKVEGLDSTKVTNSIKEVEAESVAYMVCKRIGIDSECRSFGYLASYLPEDEKKRAEAFKRSFNRIERCAEQICANVMVKNLEQTQEEEMENTPIEAYKDEYIPLEVGDIADIDEFFHHLSLNGYDDYVDYSPYEEGEGYILVDPDYHSWIETIAKERIDNRDEMDYEISL